MPGKKSNEYGSSNKNTNRNIIKAEKSQRDTGKIVLPGAPKIPTNLGQTSRAWSLTHGSQAGFKPTSLAEALGGSSGVGSRGGSVPVETTPGYQPLTADLSKNPYGPAYDELLSFIQKSAASRRPDYDRVGQELRSIQSRADADLHSSYLDSRKSADASATALGVDPNAVSSERDVANRRMQENSDQSLADRLSWLQKAQVLQGDNMQGMLAQAAAAKASSSAGWDAAEQQRIAEQNLADLQMLAASSRGGGGRGGGGGGGSSSSTGPITTTATETMSDIFGGQDAIVYQELLKTNPELAAKYLNQHILLQGTNEMKATQKQINELAPKTTYKKKPSTFGNTLKNMVGGAQATTAKKQMDSLQAILNEMIKYSGLLGTQKKTNKVTNTSKTKTS